MARPPDPAELPDSVILQQFDGLKNTVNEERLGPKDLQKALNIDLDDAGQPRRRRGYARVSTGDFHSLFTASTGTYVVKDGTLGKIDAAYNFTSLGTSVGSERLAYVEVNEDVYFSSSIASGVIRSGAVVAWGASSSADTWLSPVVNPTATLGEISGKLLRRPPMATALAHHNGRIYLANGSTLWATELFLYHYVDQTRNYRQFEHDITALGTVADGIYVGTEGGTYFLAGSRLEELRLRRVSTFAVLPGSMVKVPADRVSAQIPGNQGGSSREAILFMTDSGLCVGLDGGVCYDLTQDRFLFPDAVSAAAMVREQDGFTQYVGVTDSRGAPTSSARFGDYIEAEIVRAVRGN